MPAEIGKQGSCLLFQGESGSQIRERVGVASRQDLPAQCQGVDPGTEAVGRKDTQVAPLRAGPVGHDPAPGEAGFDLRPEREERGGPGKISVSDAVDALGGPGDRSLRPQVAAVQ